MRPIVIQQRRLEAVQQDLESAAEELTSAVERVHPPAANYPWHRLVEEGVRLLLDDTRVMAEKCTRVAASVRDSLGDFNELDSYVAITAQVDQVHTNGQLTGHVLPPQGPAEIGLPPVNLP